MANPPKPAKPEATHYVAKAAMILPDMSHIPAGETFHRDTFIRPFGNNLAGANRLRAVVKRGLVIPVLEPGAEPEGPDVFEPEVQLHERSDDELRGMLAEAGVPSEGLDRDAMIGMLSA